MVVKYKDISNENFIELIQYLDGGENFLHLDEVTLPEKNDVKKWVMMSNDDPTEPEGEEVLAFARLVIAKPSYDAILNLSWSVVIEIPDYFNLGYYGFSLQNEPDLHYCGQHSPVPNKFLIAIHNIATS